MRWFFCTIYFQKRKTRFSRPYFFISKMIKEYLTQLFGDQETPSSREPAVAHVIDKNSTTIPVKFKSDIDALQSKYEAEFKPGMRIELSLQDALQLLPRDRKRCDAYHTLQVWLEENMNIFLTIKSRKTK